MKTNHQKISKTKPLTRAIKYVGSEKKANSNIIEHEKTESIRINKFISEKGVCSRREADKLIQEGKVKINDKIAEMGSKIFPEDKVYLNNKLLTVDEKHVYIALNKPVGITCTTDQRVKGNIVEFMNYSKRIYPVGRLDKDSEGLILLTNDGDVVNKILRARNNHEKEYIVTVNKEINSTFIAGMSKGVPILDTITKPCTIYKEGSSTFRIILTQGLNRQIRRMCEYFGYRVIKLKRIRIMNILLGDLPTGQWRYLTKDELSTLNNLITDSIKTKEASL